MPLIHTVQYEDVRLGDHVYIWSTPVYRHFGVVVKQPEPPHYAESGRVVEFNWSSGVWRWTTEDFAAWLEHFHGGRFRDHVRCFEGVNGALLVHMTEVGHFMNYCPDTGARICDALHEYLTQVDQQPRASDRRGIKVQEVPLLTFTRYGRRKLRRVAYGDSRVMHILKKVFASGTSFTSVPEVTSGAVVAQARQALLEEWEYTLFGNNCEHFAYYCKTGQLYSHQVDRLVNETTAMLTTVVKSAGIEAVTRLLNEGMVSHVAQAGKLLAPGARICLSVGLAVPMAIGAEVLLSLYRYSQYSQDKITYQQMQVNNYKSWCSSAFMVGGMVAGSLLIPIPFLGSIVGGLSGAFVGWMLSNVVFRDPGSPASAACVQIRVELPLAAAMIPYGPPVEWTWLDKKVVTIADVPWPAWVRGHPGEEPVSLKAIDILMLPDDMAFVTPFVLERRYRQEATWWHPDKWRGRRYASAEDRVALELIVQVVCATLSAARDELKTWLETISTTRWAPKRYSQPDILRLPPAPTPPRQRSEPVRVPQTPTIIPKMSLSDCSPLWDMCQGYAPMRSSLYSSPGGSWG